MATLYKNKKDGELYMETYLDDELLYEKMDDRSDEYNFPKQFVFEEGCEFLDKKEVPNLTKVSSGYHLVEYPSGEGGCYWRWVKEKAVKNLVFKEFKACENFTQLKKTFKKYWLFEYL